MLKSDSLDVMLHSACDMDALVWNTDAGILWGSNSPGPAPAAAPSSLAIVWTCGASVGPVGAAPALPSDEEE